MHERVGAIEADASREGIRDRREHMFEPAAGVGRRHRLQRGRAGSEHQIKRAADDLAGDRVGLGHVALGVVAEDLHRLAIDKASLGEPRDHPFDGILEHR